MALSENIDGRVSATTQPPHAELVAPSDLVPGMEIDTPEGTWSMQRAGLLDLDTITVFEHGRHLDSPSKRDVPVVTDINTYTADIVEQELERERLHRPRRGRERVTTKPQLSGTIFSPAPGTSR